jgi:hypothetical protein
MLEKVDFPAIASRDKEGPNKGVLPMTSPTGTADAIALLGAGAFAASVDRVLDLLREKRPCGKYVAFSGEKLAAKLGIAAGGNAVSEAVKRFRDTVVERLEVKGITCGRKDVLLSGGVGYRLAESLVIHDETK